MKSPAEELRQRLLAYRSAVARARLEALVSDGEADRPDPTGAVLRGCARARAALASDEALDLLDEGVRLGLFEAGEPGALRLHLARARGDAAIAEAPGEGVDHLRRPLASMPPPRPTPDEGLDELLGEGRADRGEALLRGLVELARTRAPEVIAARRRVDDAAGTVRRGRAGPGDGSPGRPPGGADLAVFGGSPRPAGGSSSLLLLPDPVSLPSLPGGGGDEGDGREAQSGRGRESGAGEPPDPFAHPDAGPPAEALRTLARAWLDGTADACRTLDGTDGDDGFLARLRTLRGSSLDGLVRGRSRPRRLADDLWRPQGFERELASSVRLVQPGRRDGLDPRPRVLPEDVPRRVAVVPAGRPLGVAGELILAEALGRAVALAATQPGLPPAFAHPVAGTVGRALGAAHASLLADPVHLEGVRGLEGSPREALQRQAARVLLVASRFWAAATIARGVPRDARPEAADALFDEVLGTPAPEGLGRLLLLAPAGPGARFRGLVGGLALGWVLRERLDEDWSRNPRTAEVLRSATGAGGALSIEAWLAELGGDPTAGLERLLELQG